MKRQLVLLQILVIQRCPDLHKIISFNTKMSNFFESALNYLGSIEEEKICWSEDQDTGLSHNPLYLDAINASNIWYLKRKLKEISALRTQANAMNKQVKK